jgi:hypothetical protein
MARSRLSFAQRQIFEFVRTHPDCAISFDQLSAAVGLDRQHTIASVKQLQAMGKIRVNRGGSRQPNRYHQMPED